MARLDQGLLGGYSGKLGTTVGATWKGINVVRTYQKNVANPNTQAQVEQRQLFRDVTQFASFFLGNLVKPFWDRQAKQMSGFNAFVSTNVKSMKEIGVFDPESLIIGEGRMTNIDIEFILDAESNEIFATWDSEPLPLFGKHEDKLYLLAFNFSGEPVGYSLGKDDRQEGSTSFVLNDQFLSNECIVVWAWLSDDGLVQSTTRSEQIKAATP